MTTLRFGIMINGHLLPFWVEQIVESILNRPDCSLDLVILNCAKPVQRKSSLWKRLRNNNTLYYRYEAFDRGRNARYMTPARNLEHRLAQVPRLDVVPRGKRFVQRFEAADIEKIKARKLDVILRFGFKILKGQILDCARLGIWSYHHGDNDQYRGSCAGFWEVYDQNPVSGVTLQVLTEDLDGGTVLAKTQIRTELNSPCLNNHNLHLAGIRLFDDVVDQVQRHEFSREEFSRYFKPSPPYDKKVYRRPSNTQMLYYLGGVMAPRFVKTRLERPRTKQWLIGTVPANGVAGKTKLGPVNWCRPDASRFIADPFVVQRDGRTWIFVEDYLHERKRGHISVIEYDGERFSEPRAVIEEDHHLSFPFLLEHDGALYMLPEQSEAGALWLYRCVGFPDRWKREHKLLDGECVDPVLHRQDGKWWLFLSRNTHGFSQNNLYLFHADDLFGTWTPFKHNPLRNDLRGSRMAGCIFTDGERLLRPGQNSVKRYGGSIVLNEIRQLSVGRYEECEIGELLPPGGKWNQALHTINRSGDLLVIDGLRLISR